MEFDWDEGNRDKNLRHGVHDSEIEEALARTRGKPIGRQVGDEVRYLALGRATTSGRYLRVVYTLRVRGDRTLYRVISAVEMTASERRTYRSRR